MPVLVEAATAALSDQVTIGLVNNMPDAALQATERQFTTLLAAAAGDRPVRLRLLALPGVARSPETAAEIAARYGSTDILGGQPLDGLIVTGCEPVAQHLTDEPFWPDFTRLVDWAASHTVSTLWSCLAAHGAVLHRDGIARRRLPSKRSGLYGCTAVAADPLLAGVPPRLAMPHSRWNDLAEDDLVAHGYTVLTRSAEAGVDLFAKPAGSLFVFVQGHPEYDLDSLAREYRRDVARFLKAERADYPTLPHAYFDAATEAAFAAVQRRAQADRSAVGLRDLPRAIGFAPALAAAWQATVVPVFGNWLRLVADGARRHSLAA